MYKKEIGNRLKVLNQFIRSKAFLKGLGWILFAAAFLLLVFFVNRGAFSGVSGQSAVNVRYEKAKVLIVTGGSMKFDPASGLQGGTQNIKIKLLTGAHKNEISTIQNLVSNINNVVAHAGQTLIVRINSQSSSYYTVSVYSYYRAPFIYGFILLFFIVLCTVGGKKGAKSVLGLLFSFLCVVFLYIPLIMYGWNPLVAALLIISLVTVVTMLLLDGFSSKAFSAILGTLAGVLIAVGISLAAGGLIHLTGYNMQDAETLSEVANGTKLNIAGVLFGAILISALGAVIDIAISIASAIFEVYGGNPEQSKKGLFLSGLNVGRDMMGTMANTLIMAFAGTSLTTLLLIYTYNVPYIQLINTDLVGVEIVQGLSGCIAVVLTVPIIAFVASRLIPWFSHAEGGADHQPAFRPRASGKPKPVGSNGKR
jgi:uncharacterized membrane protein